MIAHPSILKPKSKIYIAGHKGLVGSAIVRRLEAMGCMNLLLKSRDELDLVDQRAVEDFFISEQPEFVILAAAKVGGIYANNTYPAEFIYENLMIQNNIIHASYNQSVNRLLFLGSSCIYPKFAPQPMKEELLLSGSLEPTNEAYAVAKIAGIKMCESYNTQYQTRYLSVMPTNLYGPGDNFDLENSHVLPALIRKIHEAKCDGRKTITIWGTGTPLREFLHIDDMASACLYLLNLPEINYNLIIKGYKPSTVNIGVGTDISIRELAEMIMEIIGFQGELVFDASKPDGSPKKLLDVSRMNKLGWHASISLREGIINTYEWYLSSKTSKE